MGSSKAYIESSVVDYAHERARESELLAALRHETAQLPQAQMQISRDQGAFLHFFAKTLGVKRALEIGTFTGYSAIAVASALPDDGSLIACDVSDEWTQIARRYWERAGLASKIELRLGPALDTVASLRSSAPFDFVFIDADKESYDAYYEASLALLRPGGVIALDNMLWDGEVAAPQSEKARLLDALNRKVQNDERVDASLLTLADGLLLARKR